MSEALTQRVKRLISGSANMIVSAMEDLAPEAVMEEAVREVDSAIDEVRSELGQILTRQHHASQRMATESQRHGELDEKIRVALKEQRADLAEAGVAQLLDIEAQIPVLESVVAETREAQTELEGYIGALQARRREMQDDLEQFLRAQCTAAHRPGGPDGNDKSSGTDLRVQKASESFSRVMARAGGLGLGASDVDRKTAALAAELDELARQDRVKERLAAMREAV